jgi:hypothetical protein
MQRREIRLWTFYVFRRDGFSRVRVGFPGSRYKLFRTRWDEQINAQVGMRNAARLLIMSNRIR